jgi:hypothetical protein
MALVAVPVVSLRAVLTSSLVGVGGHETLRRSDHVVAVPIGNDDPIRRLSRCNLTVSLTRQKRTKRELVSAVKPIDLDLASLISSKIVIGKYK